jgi:hypothetical protein
MPEGLTLAATLRYLAFVLLAVGVPGAALQRVAGVRIDPALVLPLGWACCAGVYWLALVAGFPWLLPAACIALLLALLLKRSGGWTSGPSLRGALPPFAAVVLALALAEYGQNRLESDGSLSLDGVQPDDAAFHVGLAHELTLGYPPRVPGLSGETMSYHVGAALVRAAALRYAGVHPYDALSRFDNTLYALALILALRAAARALGLSGFAQALAGWAVLATDFSFLLAAGRGIEWWVGLFEGGTSLLSVFHANSLIPALAVGLGALVAVSRHEAGEGRGFLALAVVLAGACAFFKVFLAAQLAAGLAAAFLLGERRRAVAPVLLASASTTALLALGPGGATMQIVFEPFRIVEDARADLGLGAAAGLTFGLWVAVWLLLGLGLRVAGLAAGLRALSSRRATPAALAVIALSGWVLGLFFRVSPVEAGQRERPFNEALYFFEQSGFVLWLFAAAALSRLRRRGLPAGALCAVAAALALPSTLQFVWQKTRTPPQRVSASAVRAMAALASASRPGDVVLVNPDRQRFPPPPLLIGRRVPYTRSIPFFNQFTPRPGRLAHYRDAAAFYSTGDAAEARRAADAVGARFACVFGVEELRFRKEELLEPIFEEAGAKVYRLR